jgi:hypothetical protein
LAAIPRRVPRLIYRRVAADDFHRGDSIVTLR